MASKADIRDISPLLKKLRDFLLGRGHTKALRFPPEVATRSPPLPILPEGPSHRLFNNYYYSRDGRRELMPPSLIYPAQKQIAAASPKEASVGAQRAPKPGNVYAWD
ncbi:NADH dehydrogenase [ubiquinone] 1 alpha subcomplex subunit 7-like [Onthophagus taurus]|uniref:NADH dehydrogenase [ubiquinone] 1 alpha subcomplex subunit 7-like n=1 Tax=Onthophagus taurus TaxID=166361 RepID=UPI000C20C704|nr:NADH dehydrogenase [ubiquinone] 1 alpha subcomplex subunit 7-like [Onthophagus taurus]